MDWSNVTAEDLIKALREVDCSSPPRPLSEFFSRFSVPHSYSKWNSRLKCNFYYLGFLRRPLAIVAAQSIAISIAFLNDSWAQASAYACGLMLMIGLVCCCLGTKSRLHTDTSSSTTGDCSCDGGHVCV